MKPTPEQRARDAEICLGVLFLSAYVIDAAQRGRLDFVPVGAMAALTHIIFLGAFAYTMFHAPRRYISYCCIAFLFVSWFVKAITNIAQSGW